MMKKNPIPYPTNYDNKRVHNEHIRGVVLVWVLVVLIAALITATAILSASGIGLIRNSMLVTKLIESFFPNNTPAKIESQPTPVPEKSGEAAPIVTPAPNRSEVIVLPSETATPAPQATVQPAFVPDPDFAEDAAKPYATEFESLPDVVEAVAPGVVTVMNWQTYEANGQLVEFGSGSGFFVTTDGYILTNAHVIDGAERVTVMLYDGTTHEAKVIGLDRTSDTAVVKIEGSNLTALPLGDSDAIRVGESVFVVGEPVRRELAGSVTSGIISAKERTITIEGYTNTYIQTDAAINFGSSGGPLLNAQGYVIGMAGAKTVTAGYDSYGNPVNAEGIGYALPINRVWEIATQLITTGRVERPGIGITISQARAEYAAEGTETRPYVAAVNAGSPAEQAGMQANDVILALNGIEFDDYSAIVNYIREKTHVGDTVIFTVERNGEKIDLPVVIGDLNQ